MSKSVKNRENIRAINNFKNLCNKNFSRLGQTFKTKDNKYYYDSGTGKVFMCDDTEYFILDHLISTSDFDSLKELGFKSDDILNSLNTLYDLQNCEDIFQMPQFNNFVSNEDGSDERSEVKQIILEVTQQCNLRCKYCVYGDNCSYFRDFDNINMNWDTAKRVIDNLITNSGEELIIGFYGGEPFLNFELIKQCINYCKKFVNIKKIHYSFTSNLTLITKEIASFLASLEYVTILCSIDGPKKYHDEYRRYSNGCGSFDNTMEGLSNLISAFGNKSKDIISINSVICPPYNKEKLDEIKAFFEDKNLFPEGIRFRYTYVSYGSLKSTGINTFSSPSKSMIGEFYSQELHKSDPIKYWALTNLCKNKNIRYEKSIESFNLFKMQNRPLYDSPIPFLNRNGCCTPGFNRIYVTSNGQFKVCEKIGDSPYFGDVKNGLCEECIQKKYIEEYDIYSLNKCNQCWAVHLCDVCYSTCYDENGLNIEKKEKTCISARKNAKHNLIEYYQILETTPELIDEIQLINMTKFDE